MKKHVPAPVFTLLILLFTLQSFAQVTNNDFNKLEWIIGTWNRTNTAKGESGQEKWSKVSDKEMQGFGYTMQDNDSSAIEKLKLIVKKDRIYYIADLRGNPEPVWYRLTEISNDGFACENLEYEFPKRIEYHKNGNRIRATISGNGKSIDFSFKKQKE